MNVTLQEAVGIYARASLAWFGDHAIEKTEEKIKLLAAKGDNEGVGVFERVKAEIRGLEGRPRRRDTFAPFRP